MKIRSRTGREIATLSNWEEWFKSKRDPRQWKEGRSAYSLADFIINRDGIPTGSRSWRPSWAPASSWTTRRLNWERSSTYTATPLNLTWESAVKPPRARASSSGWKPRLMSPLTTKLWEPTMRPH